MVDPWPGFVPPQLPRLISVPPAEVNWVHEAKYDGYRIQTQLRAGIGTLLTRKGLDWSNSFPKLLAALEEIPVESAILDGEVVAQDESGRGHFQLLQNSLKSKDDGNLSYYVFDLLYLNGVDLRSLPFLERKRLLNELLGGVRGNIFYSEHFESPGREFFQLSCEHGLEGMVSKRADAAYHSGRGETWVKVKCHRRQEFVIGGWTNPNGGRPGLGALLLGVYEGNDLRYAGKVGTGFSQKTLRSLRKELGELEIQESPFDRNSPKGGAHWVRPELVCEVQFTEWTSEEILRHPSFLGIREDKPPREIGMEKPNLSSPDKILFEKEGKTKRDVARYYETVAPLMLKALSRRPLSLVRCPAGSTKKCFFQKHFSGELPESFRSFELPEESGEGTYVSIDSPEGLLEFVQLNAFELHAWNCRDDDPTHPDQIVMDFDPGPGVPWKEVVEGALELREILDDLELKSFVKLTGGKGIHVHVPILPLYDWEQVKSFAYTLALELVARNPRRFVANMSKKLRRGKIFVDYLRNGYGATAVAAYSLRARETTAVALPVSWAELKRIHDPGVFTMDKVIRKLRTRKTDPWEAMYRLRQRIKILKPSLQAAA